MEEKLEVVVIFCTVKLMFAGKLNTYIYCFVVDHAKNLFFAWSIFWLAFAILFVCVALGFSVHRSNKARGNV